ncbi:MAG: DNA translocase FtsK [Acidobacteriota bacterium]
MSSKPRVKKANKRSLANEILAIVLALIAILLLLSLVTYDPKDPSWHSVGPQQKPTNFIGAFGAYAGNLLLEWFGIAALAIPLLLAFIGWRMFFNESLSVPLRKGISSTFLLIALSGFLALFPKMGLAMLEHSSSNGGMVGYIVEGAFAGVLNTIGAAIVLTFAMAVLLMLTLELSVSHIAAWVRSVKQSGVITNKSGLGFTERLRGWWAEHRERRRIAAEERRQFEAEQLRLEEAENLARERETQAETRRKKLSEENREKRVKEEKPVAAVLADALKKEEASEVKPEPIITPVVAKPVRTEAAQNGNPKIESAKDELKEPQRLVATAQTTQTTATNGQATTPAASEATDPATPAPNARTHAAAAYRAYTTKTEQLKAGRDLASEITMDPDVVEMTSTAYIERTVPTKPLGTAKPEKEETSRRKVVVQKAHYEMPSIGLLEVPIGHNEQAEGELRERATILAEKCKEFGVVGHIHRINPGPVVTTFEFKPDPGIKYARVVGLADDLCLALKAESIRIDRIPGKSTVGIEAPNLHREKILLREVIESPRFQNSKSKLTVALGKTINGEEYITDLADMPHLLIAGATGAGKSVTMNALICSILYKASPDEVKFIMVDPKRVELGLYENIPHLLTPIVTDPKRAANALKWAVNEMENRYKELAKYGVRNIEQYNKQVEELTHPTLSADDPNAPKHLPYIVIAIDELADLMMVARSEVETSIARLAQMARAVGIHLVLATQRPSVDIITGVIKANIPSRIAFRVSSKVDSRTIIDTNGAEALLGQGDMLFLPPRTSRIIRVHGSFVNEAEVKAISDHARKQAEPNFNELVTMTEQEAEGVTGELGERDELYDEALMIVIDMGRASTSVLQRRLSIGYGRAAKILDMMEREGFIGPAEGSKPRKVLSAAYEFRDRLSEMQEEDFD